MATYDFECDTVLLLLFKTSLQMLIASRTRYDNILRRKIFSFERTFACLLVCWLYSCSLFGSLSLSENLLIMLSVFLYSLSRTPSWSRSSTEYLLVFSRIISVDSDRWVRIMLRLTECKLILWILSTIIAQSIDWLICSKDVCGSSYCSKNMLSSIKVQNFLYFTRRVTGQSVLIARKKKLRSCWHRKTKIICMMSSGHNYA